MRTIERFTIALLLACSGAVASPCPGEDWAVALPGLHIDFDSIEGQMRIGGWYGFRKETHDDGCSPKIYPSMEAAGSARESLIALTVPSGTIEYSYSGRRYWDFESKAPAGSFWKRGTSFKCESSIDYVPPPEEPFENEFFSVDSRTRVVSDSERLFEFEGDVRPPCAFRAKQSSSYVGPSSDPVIARGMRFTLLEEQDLESMEGIEEQMANAFVVWVTDPFFGSVIPVPVELLSPAQYAEAFPQPYWASTDSPVAYRSDFFELTPAFETASPGEAAHGLVLARMVTFEARLAASCRGVYEIEEVFRDSKRDPDSACGVEGKWTRRKTVTLQPEPDGRAVYAGAVPTKPQTLTQLVEIRYRRVPECDQVAGATSNDLGSIRHRLSLGAGSAPGVAGALYLEADSVAEALDASALRTSGLAAIRDPADGRLLQAAGLTLVADVSEEDDGFAVRLYEHDAVELAPGADSAVYVFASGAVPVKTVLYQDPDYTGDGTSPRERLRVSEFSGGNPAPDVVREYRHDPATGEWILDDSRWDRLTRRLESDLGGGRRSELETVETTSGEILSGRERIYQSFGSGDAAFERLVEDRRYREFDAAGEGVPETALTETYSYRTDSSDPAYLGRLLERVTSEGDWERWEYPDPPPEFPDARIERVVRPIGNNPPGSAAGSNHVTETMARDAILGGQSGRLYSKVERRAGVQKVRELRFVHADGALEKTVTRRYMEPGGVDDVDWGAGPFAETVEWTHPEGPLAGKPARVDTPDGLSVRHSYHWSIDPDHGTGQVLHTVTESGTVDPDGGPFVPVLRTVSWEGAEGEVRERRTYDLGDGELLVDWVIRSDFDPAGRPRRVDYFDGTSETMEYDCCGLAWKVGRTGLQTDFRYFPDGAVAATTVRGIEMRTERGYAEDTVAGVAGEEWTTVRTGTDDSEIETGAVLRDRTGRIVRARDALGNVTRYDYLLEADGTRAETTTLPDGLSQEVRRVRRDGRVESVRGTAVLPTRYEYGVAADSHDGRSFNATFEREIRLLADGSDAAEYRTVWRDMLGRVYKIETPAPDGGGPVATLRFHDAAGRVVREVDPDGVTWLFAHDAVGRETVTALDVDRDGEIDFGGPDTVSRRLTVFEETDDGAGGLAPALARRSYVYPDGGEALSGEALRYLDRLESLESGPGWSLRTVTALTGGGDYTVRSTDAFGVERVETFAGGYLVDDALVSSDGSLDVGRAFVHDPHGRIRSETGRPGQTTVFHYHDDDSLHRLTGPESAPGEGDERIVEFDTAWDSVAGGTVRTITLPDGSETFRRFGARGALAEVSGSAAGGFPYRLEYDHAGRIRRLTTWQSGMAGGDGVVTEWRYNPAGLLEEKVYDLGGAEEQAGARYGYTPGGRMRLLERARVDGDGLRLRTDFYHALDGTDWSGRLEQVDHADTTPDVVYGYDRLGRVSSIDDASGRRTFNFDGVATRIDRIDYVSGPLAGAWLDYDWNADRIDLRAAAGPSGAVFTDDYDHDGLGRLNGLANGAVHFQFHYLDGTHLHSGTSTHLDGAAVMSSGRDHNLRDELDRADWSHAAGASGVTVYRHDALGRRSTGEDPQGRYWVWNYDGLGQLNSAAKRIRSGAVPDPATDPVVPGYRFDYLHDTIGNRENTAVNGRAADWLADRLNRYEWREVPRAYDVRGESAAGAVVTVEGAAAERDGTYFWTDPDLAALGPEAASDELEVEAVLPDGDPVTTDPRHTGSVHAQLPPDPEVFSHDADGNRTADGRWRYEWDARNRLAGIESLAQDAAGLPELRVEYDYDAEGRRFRGTVLEPNGAGALEPTSASLYLFDGWNPVVELGRAAPTDPWQIARHCVWGPDLGGGLNTAGGVGGLLAVGQDGSTLLPAYDGSGNVLAVLDAATGETTARFEYGPFGEPLRATGPAAADFPYRFSTKHTDPDSGLLYYGYRHYDPDTGRWLNRDPAGEFGGLNLYAFVDNNPVNAVDPFGLDTYAIDGTHANVLAPDAKWKSTNVSDFIDRLDSSEVGRYYGGPGVTPHSSRRGGKTWNGATGAETYHIVQEVLEEICNDKNAAEREGRDFKVNLVGWSRGATAAVWIAKELERKGCDCGDGRKESVPVNFLGLYDAVEMIPAGPLMPGHRLPEWLPGDQGPPNSVPPNVQNFFHAQKTGGRFIRSKIPLPTTDFGHPGEIGFPTREAYYTGYGRSRKTTTKSDHGEIGVSPSATEAHAEMLNAASRAGVPVNTNNPYVHFP